MSNAVRILAFAGARDLVGSGEVEFPLNGPCTASELLQAICERYPALFPFKSSLRVAVNGTYAEAGDRVTFGDEVALIPPVAGG